MRRELGEAGAEAFDIFDGGCAEEAAVLAAELRRTGVADVAADGAGIEGFRGAGGAGLPGGEAVFGIGGGSWR